ncbi:YdeI/OmpD-associated family protein [Deinococcus sp.]|uniref:YdeI/OmpD-associated family protein n=1 Tax=Deinococcus sp. TaxID=47478 RepID=UPI003B5A13B9
MATLPDNVFEPPSRAEWRSWLEAHHARNGGVWLVLHKKASPTPNLTYAEAVQEALCFGWIDSKPRKLDELRSLLYFAPRKTKSGWSALNKARIERLEAAGQMHPAGLALIEAAKADGSWALLDGVDALDVPPDLQTALEAADALDNWNAFPPSARRGILEWIVQAKTAPTRARRIQETAQKAAQNERANQWRKARP